MGSTFVASLKSIGTAVTLAGVGVYLHQNGFVSNDGKRTLALLSQQVTFPLYLFTKILYCNQDWSEEPCPDITTTLEDVWMLLFWPLYVVGTGILVGWFVATVTNTPTKRVRSVIAACAFGNSTGLPITLLTVIHSNFRSTTSDLGNVDPTLFLSVYLLLYPALQWGIGGWMLAPVDDELDENNDMKDKDHSSVEKGDTGVADVNNGESPHRIRSLSQRGMGGSFRHSVLNNKPVQEFYKCHRHGLSSADEGLYVSEL